MKNLIGAKLIVNNRTLGKIKGAVTLWKKGKPIYHDIGIIPLRNKIDLGFELKED